MSGEIHVYSPGSWHDDAYIVGTSKGLKSLLAAVRTATEEGESCVQLFTGDGEGFNLRIVQVDDEEMVFMRVPYTEELAKENRDKCIHPHTLVGKKDDK